MYSKIAINNVKKSFKDYTIYFLTIAFAVCIFYSFNSIESQKALLDMNKNQAEYMSLVTTLISYVSVFVSFILGGLTDTEAADEDTFDYEEAYEETSDKETEDMLNEEGDQE